MNLIFKKYMLLLVPLASGCAINKDLLTAGEQESTGATAGGDPTEVEPTGGADSGDTDCGDAECPGGFPPSQCLEALAWNDGLIGMTHQTIALDGEETLRTILAHVDPDTHALTPFAEGYPRNDGRTMVIGADGAIYTGGAVGAFGGSEEAAAQWLLKYSQEGVVQWSVKPGDNGESASIVRDLALNGDELVVLGENGELRGRSTASGGLLWELPQTDGTRFHDIGVDGEGALHVVGHAPSGPDDMPVNTWFIRKLAADRTVLWEDVEVPADPGGQVFSDGFVFDEAGGLIVALSESGADLQVSVRRLRKYDATGAELWTRDMPGLEPHEYVGRFYTRPGGGMIAIGRPFGIDNQTGAVTIAFGSEGELLWVDRQLHPELGDVRNNAAVIADGTVMVSGCGLGPPNTGTKGWLLKFAP